MAQGPDPDHPLEVTLYRFLETHGFRGGWLAREGSWQRPEGRKGRWMCACGNQGDLELGESILGAHRAHLAQQLRLILDAFLVTR